MRAFFLKTSLVAVLVAGLLFVGGAFSTSDATPVPAETIAAFKVIDNFGTGGGDGTVKLSFSTNIYGLQYGYGTSWNNLSLPEVFPGWYTGTLDVTITGSDFSKTVYFKTGTDDNKAVIVFSTPDSSLWHNVALNFDPTNGTSSIAFAAVVPSTDNNDHVAPVPIPPTVWIFGSALLGLIGMRRKITH